MFVVLLVIDPTSYELGSPAKPGRFIVERLGDHGYDEICRLLAAEESEEWARQFRDAVDREIEEGRKVQLQVEEIEETNTLRLLRINAIYEYRSVREFLTGVELSNSCNTVSVPKF
ncbi:hypothetical protein ACFSE1_06055 [Rhizobium helianthi]|uniref:Uncharacterized protein n=1 Tax=Rhizobium helianthi TaxID=1132695 RepID=A0ABW4M188_9HYPH